MYLSTNVAIIWGDLFFHVGICALKVVNKKYTEWLENKFFYPFQWNGCKGSCQRQHIMLFEPCQKTKLPPIFMYPAETKPRWDCSLQLPCWCWPSSLTQVGVVCDWRPQSYLLLLLLCVLLHLLLRVLLLLMTCVCCSHLQRLRRTPSSSSSHSLVSEWLRWAKSLLRRPRLPLIASTTARPCPRQGKRAQKCIQMITCTPWMFLTHFFSSGTGLQNGLRRWRPRFRKLPSRHAQPPLHLIHVLPSPQPLTSSSSRYLTRNIALPTRQNGSIASLWRCFYVIFALKMSKNENVLFKHCVSISISQCKGKEHRLSVLSWNGRVCWRCLMSINEQFWSMTVWPPYVVSNTAIHFLRNCF